MVQLILSSAKGNQGVKYFPFVGYLGLTPVRVEGFVRTKLDSDLKTLPAKSLTISVRCYESRLGSLNALQSNVLVDYTQTLWSKPDGADYEHVGVLEFPFRIWLPTTTKGFSTATFVDYRCTWRVEAVLNHAPITGVGSRQMRHFELPLVRYDVPRPLALPEPQGIVLDHQTTKPKAPRIRYSLRMPTTPTGPLDLVSIPLHMLPHDPAVLVRSASVIIERRIQLHDPQAVPSSASSTSLHQIHQPDPTSSPSMPSEFPSSSQHGSPQPPHDAPPSASRQQQQYQHRPTQSTSSLSSSNPTITPETVHSSSASVVTFSSDQPLLSQTTSSSAASSQPVHHLGYSSPQTPAAPSHPGQSSAQTPSTSSSPPSSYSSPFSFTSGSASSPPSNNSKVVVNLIVGTETENFTRDPRGIFSKTLTLQWPASKSHSRWAIGETINSDLVSVRYFVRIKITVSSPSGTDTIELAEKELFVVSTNESERQLALAKYSELAESSSSAVMDSNMVRSKSKSPRRLKPDKDGKLPPDLPPSPALPRDGPKAKTPRRPHTSAGPRDKSSLAKATASTISAGEGNSKRRSDLTWNHSFPTNPDYNALWNGITRDEPKRDDKEKEKKKKTRAGSSSGRLSSNSFWAITPPPSKPSKTKGSSAAHDTRSTSTSGSVSSVSSDRSGLRHRGVVSVPTPTAEMGIVYSSSGTDEEEERRRRRKRYHFQQRERAPLSSSPPSSFQPPAGRARDNGDSHLVREWEEELARIEQKSRKESDAAGFGRLRKRSLMSTVKGFLTSGNSSS